MNVVAPDVGTRHVANNKPASKFRSDIEGLRAIAVISVVVWHAGVLQLPGGFVGVDVFFVISGFLMTGILYRELVSGGRVNFLQFFARRVKRLIPASVLAISVTMVASWIILSPSRVLEIAYDAIAATFYVVNWRLSEGAVDYFAQDQSASPLQHYWSLAVEEQFYILWPLLLGAVGMLAGWRLFSIRSGVVGALGLVFVSSLSWSIYFTSVDQSRAYFVTTTRLWELALGGLVAIAVANRAAYPKSISALLSWFGLASIIAAVCLFNTGMAFPGWIALLPTAGTALLIAFTPSAGSAGPGALLSLRPMTWVGSVSYSLYLWHWPVIVLGGALITKSARDFTVTEGLILAVISVVPAWLSLKFFEDPIRKSEWASFHLVNTLFVGLVASGIALVLAMSMATSIRVYEPINEAQAAPSAFLNEGGDGSSDTEPEKVGAELLSPDPASSPAGELKDVVEGIYPSPSAALAARSMSARFGCHASFEESNFSPCAFGDVDSETTIMIAGDSHAGHWVPALAKVAEERAWKLLVATKSSCPLTTASISHASTGDYPSCSEWNSNALEYIQEVGPDILVMSNSSYDSTAEGGRAGFIAGGVEVVNVAQESGASVIALRDIPRPPIHVAECADANRESLSRCAFDRDTAIASSDQSQKEIVARAGIPQIDLSDWICPRPTCAPVVGGILVWRDTNHLTNEYSATLGDVLGERIDGFIA